MACIPGEDGIYEQTEQSNLKYNKHQGLHRDYILDFNFWLWKHLASYSGSAIAKLSWETAPTWSVRPSNIFVAIGMEL